MTRDEFERELLAVRNGASGEVPLLVLERRPVKDTMVIWHTTEIALGILSVCYVPKRESVALVRELLGTW